MSTAASVATPGAASAVPASATRRRRAIVWTLVVAASVIALVSILTTWVNRQILDDHAWTTASEELIQDPAVQDALSVFLVNQLYASVNVQQALAQKLPPDTKQLAGPIAGALRGPATSAVSALLARPRVQQLWINASATAHEKLVNVLENKTGNGISTGNGEVTLDLNQLVQELGKSLGLSDEALAKLPATAGEITVMKSDQLGTAQTGVRVLKVSSWALLVVVFGLFALAVYLARGFRRRTLRNVGWAFVVVGLLTLIARRWLGTYVTDALAAPGYQVAGHHAWLIGTSILGQIGRAAVLYGLVAIVGAVFAGPTELATNLRRRAAPTLNRHQGTAWGAVALAYILLVLWGGTHALRIWWGILLLGGLLALGIVALRRQTLREFPDAGVKDTVEPEAAPAPRSAQPRGATLPATPTADSPAEEIARLKELRDTGAISAGEFERGKQLALR